MAAIEKGKKTVRPVTARILVVIFLLLGSALGFLTMPMPIVSSLLPVINFPYRFGLDIQGGTHLVYRADMASMASSEQSSSMEAVRDIIERRVNLFGVSEPVVQTERAGNEWRLIVELAGIRDTNAAIKLI